MAVNGTTLNDDSPLTLAEAKKLTAGAVVSVPWGDEDRLFRDYREFSTLYEETDLDLRAMRGMLRKDGTPRKLEQVLSLPVRGAPWTVQGSGDIADAVRARVAPLLGKIIDQATSAFSYRKAFFELEWTLNGPDVDLVGAHFRPAYTCRAAWDEKTLAPAGFRQELVGLGATEMFRRSQDGWARVPAARSFIYTHGTHREPVAGISDLDVALYCWENIKKLQFLWFQYLEQQSLPKIGVYGDDDTEATANAKRVAKAGASGVVPMTRRGDPAHRQIDIIESSGRGADQFERAIAYLESRQTGSVLASFMDLAQNASQNARGSNALSADQSEFFLGSRQAVADELAEQITDGIIRPFVIYNFGPDADIPALKIGPIGNRQTDRALAILDTILATPSVNAPDGFPGWILNQTASSLGLDTDKVAAAVEKWETDRAARAAQLAEQLAGQGNEQAGQDAEQLTQMGRALTMSATLVRGAQLGRDPVEVLETLLPGGRRRAGRRPAGPPPGQLQLDLATETEDEPEHTGGMVALLPDAESAARLLVEGGDPLEQLHLTLTYLGDDVAGWSQGQRDQVLQRARDAASHRAPIDGEAFGHATFNPDGDEPCEVYVIGGSDAFSQLNRELRGLADALQHPGFVAHVTAGYGLTAGLTYTGPVRFDRLGVFFADQRTEIPLTGRSDADQPAAAHY